MMKLLPYSPNNEQAVLYAMMFNNDWIDRLSFLAAQDFHLRQHRALYRLMKTEFAKRGAVDLQILLDLVTDDMGGVAYLADIWKNVSTDRNALACARIMVEHSARRTAIQEYSGLVEKLYNPNENLIANVAEAMETVDHQIYRFTSDDSLSIDQLIDLSMDEMSRSASGLRIGISTGLPEIDEQIGYKKLAFGEITFLGGQSKNGKTLLANTIAAKCALRPEDTVLIFSVEMSVTSMFNGIVSAMSGVPSDFYCRQSFYAEQYAGQYDDWFKCWGQTAQALRNSNKIRIDGKKDVDMAYLCSEIRKQHAIQQSRGRRLRLVVIDHLHRLCFDVRHEARTYAMREAIRRLKNTAADLEVAVLLLGQLNEVHSDKVPSAYQILDTSGARHEIQAFIGTKLFREEGKTYLGIYVDAQRYADDHTVFTPKYMRMKGGVLRSLSFEERHWTPSEQVRPLEESRKKRFKDIYATPPPKPTKH